MHKFKNKEENLLLAVLASRWEGTRWQEASLTEGLTFRFLSPSLFIYLILFYVEILLTVMGSLSKLFYFILLIKCGSVGFND